MQLGEAMKAPAPPPRLPPTHLSVFRASPAEEIFPGTRMAGPGPGGGRREEPVEMTTFLEQQAGQRGTSTPLPPVSHCWPFTSSSGQRRGTSDHTPPPLHHPSPVHLPDLGSSLPFLKYPVFWFCLLTCSFPSQLHGTGVLPVLFALVPQRPDPGQLTEDTQDTRVPQLSKGDGGLLWVLRNGSCPPTWLQRGGAAKEAKEALLWASGPAHPTPTAHRLLRPFGKRWKPLPGPEAAGPRWEGEARSNYRRQGVRGPAPPVRGSGTPALINTHGLFTPR